MHEYSIAYDIVMTAKRAAVENSAKSILKVFVDVGGLSMVNPDQVIFLFKAIVGDENLFNGSELICTLVSPLTRCVCGYEGDEIYVCPGCGQLPSIEKGREIMVTNIEIEVDEV